MGLNWTGTGNEIELGSFRITTNITNCLVVEAEGSTPLIPKPAFRHDPQSVLSTSHPHNICFNFVFLVSLRPIGQPATSFYSYVFFAHLIFLMLAYLQSTVRSCKSLSPQHSGFGGLELACQPLVDKFAGSNPAEAVGFFRAKKSSARLPSDGK